MKFLLFINFPFFIMLSVVVVWLYKNYPDSINKPIVYIHLFTDVWIFLLAALYIYQHPSSGDEWFWWSNQLPIFISYGLTIHHLVSRKHFKKQHFSTIIENLQISYMFVEFDGDIIQSKSLLFPNNLRTLSEFITQFVFPEDRKKLEGWWETQLGEAFFEYRVLINGELRWIRQFVIKNHFGFHVYYQDNTEIHRINEIQSETLKELQFERTMIHLLIDTIPQAITIWTHDLKLSFHNKSADWRYAIQVTQEHSFDKIFSQERQRHYLSYIQNVMKTGKSYPFLEKIGVEWERGFIIPYFQEDYTHPAGVMIFSEDVSEYRAVLAQRDVFTKTFDILPLGITISDQNGIIQYVNAADAAMHGWTTEELLGHHRSVYGSDLTKSNTDDIEIEIDDGLSTHESINIRKDGSIFPVKLSRHMLHRNGHFVGQCTICQNITTELQILAELEAKNEIYDRYRLLVDNIPVGIFVFDARNHLEFQNLFFAKFEIRYGSSIGDIIKMLIMPSEVDSIISHFNQKSKEFVLVRCPTGDLYEVAFFGLVNQKRMMICYPICERECFSRIKARIDRIQEHESANSLSS